MWHRKPVVTVTRTPTPAPVAAPAAAPAPLHPLAWIVNQQLQHGHYEAGERDLRTLLAAHPEDRAARAMLAQLTDDPERRLGPPGSVHVVQAGESYSTLAQHYLGDANLFLILARYNHSDNPSRLWAGQKLRLPAKGQRPGRTEFAVASSVEKAPAVESPAVLSQRLQRESLSLLASGRDTEALARLDRALADDPGLASDAGAAAPLRQQVVAGCHERAIVLYRDQRLTPAIALWDRVLAIEPGYEPAIAYRARALELQRRLKQL